MCHCAGCSATRLALPERFGLAQLERLLRGCLPALAMPAAAHPLSLSQLLCLPLEDLLRLEISAPAPKPRLRYETAFVLGVAPGARAQDLRREGAQLAEAVLRRTRAMRILDRRTQQTIMKVTVSAGVAAMRCGDDVLSWIARADDALYKSKQAGRDRVTLA